MSAVMDASCSAPAYPQPDPQQMRKTIELLAAPDGVIELRALGAGQKPQCGYFDSSHRLTTEAERLNRGGAQVYVPLNPVRAELLARSPNRVTVAKRDEATSDADVTRRRWLLVDIDPVKPKGAGSATADEKDAAEALALETYKWLKSQGWPAPTVADSGNGTHLLFAIDLPNDDDAHDLVTGVLRALAHRFNCAAAEVDVKVGNASRITKLYGSVAKKGEHTAERPHRLSQVVRPAPRVLVTVEQLKAVAALAPAAPSNAATQLAHRQVASGTGTSAALDTRRPARPASAGLNLIGQFNAAFSAHEVFERNAYEKQGDRYMAPGSSSGMPGVTILDNGKAYSHHGSDVLADGHAHDAFDLFCTLEHGGSIAAALDAAAQLLGVDRHPPAPMNVIDIEACQALGTRKTTGASGEAMGGTDALMAAAPGVEAANDSSPIDRQPEGTIFSPRLMAPGGIVGEIVRWILDTSPKPQPALAVTAALVAVGSALANKVRCGRTYTHLYCVNVANSGEGKDRPQECIAEAFEAAGAQTRAKLPGEELASGQSLMAVASREPTTVLVLDEFGDMLSKATAKSAASFEREVLTILKKLWSHAGRTMRGKEYADQKIRPRQDVQYPCVSLLGSSTPGRFYASITPNEIEDGCLNRMLIVRAGNFAGVAAERKPQPVPAGITKWLAAASAIKPAPMAAPDDPHQPRNVACSGMAEGVLGQFAALAERERTALQADPARAALAGWWVRAAENARRIALILSMGLHTNPAQLHAKADADLLEIDCESAQWAVDYVHAIVVDMLAQSESRIGDGEFERAVLGVEAALRRAGARGLTRRDASRSCNAFERIFDPAVADRVWASVKMRGAVEAEAPPKSGRGPARRFLVCRELAEAERAA